MFDIEEFKKEYKTFVKAPFSYQGSKRNELHKIVEHQPSRFNKFIDVFGGGGSVALYYRQKYPDIPVYYNDVNPLLYNVFSTLTSEENTQELVNKLLHVDTSNIEVVVLDIHREFFENGGKDPFHYLFLKKYMFRGIVSKQQKTINMRYDKHKVLNIESRNNNIYTKYPPILCENFHVLNEDCLTLIERYKHDSEAFLYLDPPYVSTNCDEYGNFTVNNIISILNHIKDDTIQCKIMIHIEFLGYTYHELKDYMKCYYPKRYNMRVESKKQLYSKYIMIATNY